MVDQENRLKAAQLIEAFRQGSVTNDEFVNSFPRSNDKAIQAINSMLWFCYDDLHTHRLTGKHALNIEGEKLFAQCILFLNTNLEYCGETRFVTVFAPLKKFWSWITQRREPPIEAWWPFNDQTQLNRYENRLGTKT